MRSNCGYLISALLALGALLTSSCTADSNAAANAYIRSGDAYLTDRRYGEAIVQYQNAVRRNSRSGEAHQRLADAFVRDGNVEGAYREYIRAADLNPSSIDAQLRAGEMLLLARRFEEVDDHRLLTGSVVVMAAGAVIIAVVPVLAVVAVAGLVTAIGLSLAWLAMQHRSLLLRPGQVGTTNAVIGAIESTGAWLPLAIGALADRAGLTWAVGSFGVVGAVLVLLSLWDGRRSAA